MAAESIYLPSRELRFAYLLIGECCEMGADPLLWRQHLLMKLKQKLNAVGTVLVEASIDPTITGVGARFLARFGPPIAWRKPTDVICVNQR